MSDTGHVWLHLRHQLESWDATPEEFGPDGPVIGPVCVGGLYGDFRIFAEDGRSFELLPTFQSVFFYDGKFYSDLIIWPRSHLELILRHREENKLHPYPIHDYAKFEKTLGEDAPRLKRIELDYIRRAKKDRQVD
jgi:hypothetical protein